MTFFSFIAPSPFQICVVLILGVLFFGKNLPEVAKRVGLSVLELKKGLNEMGDITKEMSSESLLEKNDRKSEASEPETGTEKYEVLGSKFEPPQYMS